MVKSCVGNKINNLLPLFQKDEFLRLDQNIFSTTEEIFWLINSERDRNLRKTKLINES